MSAVQTPPDEESGPLLGDRYRLEALLGEGSFCRVHRALDTATGGRVAVKVLKPGPSSPGDAAGRAERFLRQARLCNEVHHPGVVRLLDAGRLPTGDPFAVLDLVEGRTLRALIDDEGRLSPDLSLQLMAEVLDALVAVHARGILHRDLKPENIMVSRTGAIAHAVLLDFGFEPTGGPGDCGVLAATPRYAAPEQLRGQPPTQRSDLYSWGLVLLECLTGSNPIDAERAHEAAAQQLESRAIDISPEADAMPVMAVVRRAVAKDPAQRPSSAAELLGELGRFVPALVSNTQADRACDAEARRVTVVSCRFGRPATEGAIDQDEVRREAERCAEFFTRRGGTVVAAIADRVTIAFGLFATSPDDPARAVAAAVDWVERDAPGLLGWCAGIHSGQLGLAARAGAFGSDTTFVGALASTAQHLDTVARLGRVHVSAAAAEPVRDTWSMAPLEGEGATVESFRVRRRRSDGPARTVALFQASFAGRPAELEQLRTAWRAASSGRSCTVLLCGEAGIGKSRLLQELRGCVAAGDWIEARATPETQSRPFHLIARLVAALGGSATSLATRFELDAAESVPILATLLAEPLPAGYSLPVVTPDRYKELTLQVAANLLLRAAAEEPLVVVLEDLHWADSMTLEFVTLLLGRYAGSGAAVLLLLTARPEFESPWRDGDVARIDLAGLPAADVERVIREAAGARTDLDAGTIERFLHACRGNPLFAEEAANLLRSGGGISTGSAAETGSAAAPFAALETTGDLLSARLSSLSPAALSIAQTAAALGQEFRIDLVEAVVRRYAGQVDSALQELVGSSVIVANEAGTYRFRHAVLCDAAYASIPEAERAALHRHVGTTIRSRFPEVAMQKPAELALHFERGGDSMAAAELWHQAGAIAMAMASYLDAQAHFARGLRLIEAADESPQRTQRTLGLTTGLATAHLSTQGFGAPATREAFVKARMLCTKLGREAPLEVVGGVFGSALANADNEEAAALLPLFEGLALRTDQPLQAFCGNQVLAVHACWSGQYTRADRHATISMELYRRRSVREISWEFGFGLYCYGYGMSAKYQLGFADQAEKIRQEMMAVAESSHNPYCLALALGFAATLTSDLRRPTESIELATRLLAVATEQHLYLWSAFAMCAQGNALVQLGRAEEGLTPIRAGVSLLNMLGFRCSYGYYLMYLVEALTALGETDEALAVADEGLAIYQAHWTRFAEPNMVRLRGAVLEARGDDAGAEAEYRRAIKIAQADEGLTFELRAATSLAKLLARQGGRPGANTDLSAVLGQIREGLETSDVKDAQVVCEGDGRRA